MQWNESKQQPAAHYAGLLKSCGESKDLLGGRQVHRQILSSTVHRSNDYLQHQAMLMYGKCGSTEEARSIFNQMSRRTILSWNILMAAYAHNGNVAETRKLFDLMPEKDVVSWNTIVGAYAQDGHLEEAQTLFDQMPKRTLVIWNTMTNAYAKGGKIAEAAEMFEKTPHRNVVSWNVMLTAYARNGELHKAEDLFRQMEEKNVASWNTMIAGYTRHGMLEKARSCFESMPVRDVISWNAMITANANEGCLSEARAIFDRMPNRDLVSWNAMITGYTERSNGREVFLLLGLMDLEGLEPNNTTFVNVLTVCASLAALSEGKLIHALISHRNYSSDVIVGNAVINMYVSCKLLDIAWDLFERMSNRNVATWNVMISGFFSTSEHQKALMLYGIMNLEGVRPDRITFVSVLNAIGELRAVQQGRIVLELVRNTEFFHNVVLGTALLNMFAKCGCPDEAVEFFYTMPTRNEVTFNSVIAVFVRFGHGRLALRLLQLMHLEGQEPTEVTFVNVLSAFSHGTGVSNGAAAAVEFFTGVLEDYPELLCLNHYACMVEILGRAGWLQEAEDLLRLMPFEPNAVSWTTLLGACKLHEDSVRGQAAADNVLRLDPEDQTAYVLLTSLKRMTGSK